MVECTIKKFPVLGYTGLTEVPWGIMIGHERQAIQNHSQTLERLAERGGLHPIEMACVLSNREYVVKLEGCWMELPLPVALAIIEAHIKKFERHQKINARSVDAAPGGSERQAINSFGGNAESN